MFIVAQFPLLDARPFLPVTRIGPAWPLVQPGEFIRSFGHVERRRRGTIEEWPADGHYCRAENALKFPNWFGAHVLGAGAETFAGKILFRRLYMDREAGRLEVGFEVRRRQEGATTTGAGLLSLLRSLFGIHIGVRSGGDIVARSLVKVGPAIARHYARSTLSNGKAPEDWWVQAGHPSLLVEHGRAELADLPPHSTNVVAFDFQHIDLAHCHIEYQGTPIGAWFLRRGRGVNRDELRRLRLNLVRVNEEKETTRLLLRLLAQNKLNFEGDASDRLQEFIDRMMGGLELKNRFGIAQAPLLEAAREVSSVVAPGERELLLEAISSVRATVRKKVERQTRPIVHAQVVNVIEKVETMNNKTTKVVLGDNATIHGSFNVVTAETIQNSFNTIAGSSTNENLKESLKALTVQVAELAKRAPPEQAEQIARDLESLTKEATSKTPRKKWYELSADGLVEAAKTVAGMATPVASAVKAVLAILSSG